MGPAGISRLALVLMTRNLTQTALDQVLGISQATISQYTLGKRPISARHMKLLTIALSCSPEAITGMASAEDCPVSPVEMRGTRPIFLRARNGEGLKHI
jgi:transcriptional regulator with XRE-family HTH domain